MEKLKVTVDGSEKIIEAEKFAKGIYIADDSTIVKRNIDKLAIKFDNALAHSVLQNRITKVGTWSLLTSKAANTYLQFIFMPSASNDDFNDLIYDRDEQYKQLLIQTYNMSKLTINNLDVLDQLNNTTN